MIEDFAGSDRRFCHIGVMCFSANFHLLALKTARPRSILRGGTTGVGERGPVAREPLEDMPEAIRSRGSHPIGLHMGRWIRAEMSGGSRLLRSPVFPKH